MADKALRVLAVSYLDVEKFPKEEAEQNLIFVGLIRYDRPSKRKCQKSHYYL